MNLFNRMHQYSTTKCLTLSRMHYEKYKNINDDDQYYDYDP